MKKSTNFESVGSKFSSIGQVKSRLRINKEFYKINLNLVKDEDLTQFDIIIGQDFMKKYKMGVCFNSNYITKNRIHLLPFAKNYHKNEALSVNFIKTHSNELLDSNNIVDNKNESEINATNFSPPINIKTRPKTRILQNSNVSEPSDHINLNNFIKVNKTELNNDKDIEVCIKGAHSGSFGHHRGVLSTCKKIQSKFSFTNLIRKVANYIKSCETCQYAKINKRQLEKRKLKFSKHNSRLLNKFQNPEQFQILESSSPLNIFNNYRTVKTFNSKLFNGTRKETYLNRMDIDLMY